MTLYQSITPDTLDECLTLLADHYRRATISYFRESSTEVASVKELATVISTQDHTSADRVARQLHHSALPRLADAGVIDYDVRSNTIRYRGCAGVETLMDDITEF